MNIIFKGIVGSTAYGLNTEESDIDIKGVYQQPLEDILGFKYKERIDVSKDEVYYELRKFIELIGKSNPTILEMLWLPDNMVVQTSDAFEELKRYRIDFLTKACKNSFVGYVYHQLEKAKNNKNTKNLMHVYRLLYSANDIVTNREINTYVGGMRKHLLDIRNGVENFDEILKVAENFVQEIKVKFDKSDLPESIDQEMLHNLLVKLRL